MKKALSLEVFRTARLGDCTNNGISSQFHSVLLIHPEGYIDVADDGSNHLGLPVVEIETKIGGYKCLKQVGDTRWLMFGGNFAYTSDSRFREINAYPLPIHDRYEGR